MRHKLTRCAPLLLGLVLAVSLAACAGKSGPSLQWSKTFAGGHANSAQQTMDGGYIVCGSSSEDIWLMKTDAQGNKLWDKTFDAEFEDEGFSVRQTADGGYIVCGDRRSAGYYNSEDIWLIKTDADGNKLWDKTFGGEDSDPGASVQQTTDGGYIVCGSTASYGTGSYDTWLIKTDADGNKLWDKTFGGENMADWGNSAQQTTDGGYVVCGSTESHNRSSLVSDEDGWLIKTDADGNKLWDRKFDGLWDDSGYSVQQTEDGGYIICGITASRGENAPEDIWLVRTDAEGNRLWDETFDVGGGDQGYSVQQSADDGYIICGTTFFHLGWFPTGQQLTLIKTDADGNKLWSKTLGGESQDYGGESVRQTADGGYIVCGWHESDALLWRIAPER
ncbi:MAG: hypothetical protein A2Z75_08070 [Chloroflexi bacterium RBG_13_50_10]|nr:MAG: hypothetical protein A2Z75_08070 [Chloroflexi bacterium RBG_13_50_10]